MPEKRRNPIMIPGRSGAFRQEDGGRAVRQESITCSFVRPPDIDVAQHARLIAGWLSEEGELNFDSEPDKYYRAYLIGAPPLVKHLLYGQFSLSFEMNPPFAYQLPQSLDLEVIDQTPIVLMVGGTAKTPVRIIIRNDGTTTIRNLVLLHSTI
jgi:phage-related protein